MHLNKLSQDSLVMKVAPVSLSSATTDTSNVQVGKLKISEPGYRLAWNQPHHQTVCVEGEDAQEEEHEGIQYLKTYFEFAYYMLVCPFRFDWDIKTKTYHCHTNKFQTALHYVIFVVFGCCCILRLRSMWYETTMSIRSTSSMNDKNTTAYFDVAVYFFDSFFMLILFVNFGRQKDEVLEVFKEFQMSSPSDTRVTIVFPTRFVSLRMNEPNIHKYWKARLWSIIILTGCMSTVAIKFLEIVQNEGWDLVRFYHSKIEESKIMFIDASLVEAIPWFFVVLNVGSTLYEKVLNDFGDILFTMSVLLFKNLVESFAISLKNETDSDTVLDRYVWLKTVTTKINTAIGTMTFAFIVGNLPFFATTVLDVFGSETKNVFVRIRYIVACSYFFPSICIGASANKKVDEVKEWICKQENYRNISDTKLMVFLHDLTFHSVGLTAKGIVTVNWNSVGSVISIIISYALLKSQFK